MVRWLLLLVVVGCSGYPDVAREGCGSAQEVCEEDEMCVHFPQGGACVRECTDACECCGEAGDGGPRVCGTTAYCASVRGPVEIVETYFLE